MVELVGKVSEHGIRRSEVRFFMGNLGVFLCPTFVARRKASFSICIKVSFVKDIYIYILRSIPSLAPIACYDKSM